MPYSRRGLKKPSYTLRSAGLGKMLLSLCRSPNVLLASFNIIFKCSSIDKRLSRIMPNCFCELTFDTLLLFRNKWGMVFAYFASKYYFRSLLNPLSASVALILKPVNWIAVQNQWTGFSMRSTPELNGLIGSGLKHIVNW